MNRIPSHYLKSLPLYITIILIICLVTVVTMISAAQEVKIYTLFKDKVIFNGQEVTLENNLIEIDGTTYMAAEDLAELYNLNWSYDDSGKFHFGADPLDEGEGEIIMLGPNDYYFHALWSHITNPEWWGTFRVNNRFYDNTFRRWLFGAQSNPVQVTYCLDREYQWFSIMLGVSDDTIADNNEPVFKIIGDGEVLYETRLRHRQPIKKVYIDVSQIEFLSFRGTACNDESTNRLAIINPLLKKKHIDDRPEPAKPMHPSLFTDVLGTFQGRYYKYSKPFREPPAVVTDTDTFNAKTFQFSVLEDGWEGKLVHVGRGEAVFDFKKEELQDNICLIERSLDVSARMLYAQAAGAIGVIYYNNQAGMISNPTLTENSAGVINIPVIAISRADGTNIVNQLDQNDVAAKVQYGNSIEGLLINCGKGQDQGDYPAAVAGNIALVEEESVFLFRRNILPNAVQAGAKAVVFYNNRPGYMIGPVVDPTDIDIPVMGIAREDGLEIINALTTGKEIYAKFLDAVE